MCRGVFRCGWVPVRQGMKVGHHQVGCPPRGENSSARCRVRPTTCQGGVRPAGAPELGHDLDGPKQIGDRDEEPTHSPSWSESEVAHAERTEVPMRKVDPDAERDPYGDTAERIGDTDQSLNHDGIVQVKVTCGAERILRLPEDHSCSGCQRPEETEDRVGHKKDAEQRSREARERECHVRRPRSRASVALATDVVCSHQRSDSRDCIHAESPLHCRMDSAGRGASELLCPIKEAFTLPTEPRVGVPSRLRDGHRCQGHA